MRIEKWLHNKCEENRSPILNSLFIYPAFLNSQSPIYQVFENSIARYLEKHGHPYIQLKAVLFDMDGVLFNSMPYHADAWHKVMERHGLHLSREEAYMHEGRTGASTINIVYQRQYGKDATPEMIESIYAEKSAEFSTHPEPERMPGAWEVLQKVKAAGLIPVLVTGSGQHSLLNRLAHNFPGMFQRDHMVTAFDVKYGKPHPEPYLMGLEKAGVQANEAIVVENAPIGVQAGTAAGIFTVAVNTGPLDRQVLLDIQKASIVFLLKTLQSTHFLLLGFFNRERYPTSIFIIIVQFSGRNYINRFRTVTTPSKAKNIKQVFYRTVQQIGIHIPLVLFNVFYIEIKTYLTSPFTFYSYNISNFMNGTRCGNTLHQQIRR